MADKFLWDEESPNPKGDVENPHASIDNNAPDVRHEGSRCSTSKAAKLGLGLAAVVGAVSLGVVLGLGGSKDEPVAIQVASSASSVPNTAVQGAVAESKPQTVKSTNDYDASLGSLEPRVKMTPSASITKKKYDTCNDLENDILEALKLYTTEYITDQAVSEELYANCDPDNDNWWWDVYGYDDYVYHDLYNVDYTCDPASNNTDSCATEGKDVPWVLTWHEWDHAEGKLFYDKDEALEAYENVNASFAKRLYCPYKMQVKEYGWMGGLEWCELDTWAYEAQCSGEAPAAPSIKNTSRSNLPRPRSIEKQTRSYTPRDQKTSKQSRSNTPAGLKQPRSNIQSVRQGDSKNSKSRIKKSGGTQGVDQNSQNKDVDEKDKVVSDGTFIYAAYGDVLYAWPADGEMKEASITYMPGEAKECKWDTALPCTTISKPNIEALFLGKDNSRLTVLVSQSVYEYPAPADQSPPLVTDYGAKLDVRVYDVSEVMPGSRLNELGHKSLSGSWLDGGFVGDKAVIATSSSIDTYELTKGLSRSEQQYCSLNTTSYKELAVSTAQSKVESLAKQMVDELDLLHGCSNIDRIPTMIDDSDPDVDVLVLKGADFLLGSFIQIYSLDTSSDFDADGAIPSTVAGSFRAGYGYSMYLSDDFLALPSEIYRYNYTTSTSSYETFILAFDLSSDEKGAASVYYGHLPGQLEGKYRMDKSDHELRILTTEWSMDHETWTSNYITKIFTLGIPSTHGRMPLLSESEIFLDEGFLTTAILFSGDKTYIVVDDWNYDNKKKLIIVGMVGQMNPGVVGSLEIDSSVSYMHEIDIGGTPYILCIGTVMDTSTWLSSAALTLIDVSIPSSPKEAVFYKEEPGIASDVYDFLTIRYLDDSNQLILPFSATNYTDYMTTFTEGFSIYDISDVAITPAFNVTHSTNEHYCWYDAKVPPRSFVIQSELITVRDHTAIKSDAQSGNLISQLDLDIGFNYSSCDNWYYYGYDYSYYYDDDASNSTEV